MTCFSVISEVWLDPASFNQEGEKMSRSKMPTLKERLDLLLSSDLTYSSDLAAVLLHADEQKLIMLARRHGLAYRMIVWNPHGDIQCLKFGTEAEQRTKFSAGIAFSASGEDLFWIDEQEDKVE